MGLRMDDLHAPTVASGPTTNSTSDGASLDKYTLKELMREKDRVEAELLALSGVLDSVSYIKGQGAMKLTGYSME